MLSMRIDSMVYHLVKQDDILYVVPEVMTEEQAKRLSDLGCHIDCGSYAVYT